MWDIMSQYGAIAGILGLAFTAGYNWRRLTIVEDLIGKHLASVDIRREQMDAEIERTYARKDTLDLELKAIRSRLEYISKQLDAMRSHG